MYFKTYFHCFNYVLLVCVSVGGYYAQVLVFTEARSIVFPEAGDTEGCKPPDMGAGK